MRRPLSNREQRIAALTLLLALLMLIHEAVLVPCLIEPARALEQEMEALREAARRYQPVAGQLAEWQARQAATDVSTAQPDSLWPGEDSSAVAAGLLQHVADAVGPVATTGPGCVLNNRSPLPDASDGAVYHPVRIALSLSCGIEPLARLLATLEQAQPPLFIEQLHIERGTEAPRQGPAGRLQVQVEVTGYMTAPTGGQP